MGCYSTRPHQIHTEHALQRRARPHHIMPLQTCPKRVQLRAPLESSVRRQFSLPRRSMHDSYFIIFSLSSKKLIEWYRSSKGTPPRESPQQPSSLIYLRLFPRGGVGHTAPRSKWHVTTPPWYRRQCARGGPMGGRHPCRHHRRRHASTNVAAFSTYPPSSIGTNCKATSVSSGSRYDARGRKKALITKLRPFSTGLPIPIAIRGLRLKFDE